MSSPPCRRFMKASALTLSLILILVPLAGCSGDDGPSAYVDDVHIFVDGTFSDETVCQESIVLSSGERYECTFTLNSDAWLGIELDVASGSPLVDLITMSDINYQKWKNGEEYYYLVDISDFGTSGGSYSSNADVDAGDWVVVIVNP